MLQGGAGTGFLATRVGVNIIFNGIINMHLFFCVIANRKKERISNLFMQDTNLRKQHN